MHDKHTRINNEIRLVFNTRHCSTEDLILAILLSTTTCTFLVNEEWVFTVNNNGNFIVQSLFESSREMSYMCIMGLFACESSLVCASVHLTHLILLEFQCP